MAVYEAITTQRTEKSALYSLSEENIDPKSFPWPQGDDALEAALIYLVIENLNTRVSTF